jgi:hypothetical protein
MPGVIRALAGSGTSFSILTKGTLLRRDVALLVSAARDVPLRLVRHPGDMSQLHRYP